MMEFVGGAIIVIGLLSIVVGWIIYLIQWIFCRKKVSCDKKNCIFRLHCISRSVRTKEQLEWRKMMLEEYMKNKAEEEDKK